METKGKTILGFRFEIKKGVCILFIPKVVGKYSKCVTDTYAQLWDGQNSGELDYFNEIQIKKVAL